MAVTEGSIFNVDVETFKVAYCLAVAKYRPQ
jgi:hypothetical protein